MFPWDQFLPSGVPQQGAGQGEVGKLMLGLWHEGKDWEKSVNDGERTLRVALMAQLGSSGIAEREIQVKEQEMWLRWNGLKENTIVGNE